jgi:RNA polymerase sigma factor (sigma-70 family)
VAVLESLPTGDDLDGVLARVDARAKGVFARFRIPAQDAEDVLQQTLLVFLMREDEIHDPEAWILATLRQRCLMYWRSRRRQLYEAVDAALLDAVADHAPGVAETAQLRRDVRGALACIPGKCRSVLGARYALGCEPAEAAARLGYKPSGIYKVIERCLAALTRVMIDRGLVPKAHV